MREVRILAQVVKSDVGDGMLPLPVEFPATAIQHCKRVDLCCKRYCGLVTCQAIEGLYD